MKELEENITPASIGGMGATLLPTATQPGSGDVPAKSGDAEEEYKKKKKKMKHLKTFESFKDNSIDEAYDGAMSDFKYEFPMRFEEATGNSPKAIKRISKKGKNQYQVNTSTYMSEPEMKKVADAMGMELVSYKDGGSVKVSVFESVQLDESMSSFYFDSPSEFDAFSNDAPAKGETKYLVMANNKANFNGQEIRLEGSVRFGSTSKKQIIGIFNDEESATEAYKKAMKNPEGTFVSFTMGTLVGTSKFRSQYNEIQGYLATAKVK